MTSRDCPATLSVRRGFEPRCCLHLVAPIAVRTQRGLEERSRLINEQRAYTAGRALGIHTRDRRPQAKADGGVILTHPEVLAATRNGQDRSTSRSQWWAGGHKPDIDTVGSAAWAAVLTRGR